MSTKTEIKSLREKIESLTNIVEKLLNPPEPPKEKEFTLFLKDGEKEVVRGYNFTYYCEYKRIYIKNENGGVIAMFSEVIGFTSKSV